MERRRDNDFRRARFAAAAPWWLAGAAMAFALCSCEQLTPPLRAPEPPPTVVPEPLPVQQARAYPETVTGRFVSLADFEPNSAGVSGHMQLQYFSIEPFSNQSTTRFVVNVTRTGAGAMEVTLAPKAQLLFAIPDIHDFSGYNLLSFALYSETLRDDLQVTLVGGGGEWTSPRTLVLPGWNTVLIDIQRLIAQEGFNIRAVKTMRLLFAEAAAPVTFNLDDIMLVNNTRVIAPAPQGVVLKKNGLDYQLLLPGATGPLQLSQDAQGLWKMSNQPQVQLMSAALDPDAIGLDLLGRRKVGQVEVLENNCVRLRLANTWYFPSRAGEWISLAVRQIRWEYTFYSDGRCISHVELNNAGGEEIAWVRIVLDRKAIWFGRGADEMSDRKAFAGSIGRWNFLWAERNLTSPEIINYIKPTRLSASMTSPGAFADGDLDKDGFDESQGCYFLRAKAGHCRFTILPGSEGIPNPAFRVAGNWSGPVSVNSEGLPIRDVARLADGSVLFSLKGLLTKPTAVEVTGAPGRP